MIEWFGNIGQVLPSPWKTVTFSPPMMTSHVSNTNKKRYNDKVDRNMGVDKSTDDAMIVRDIIASRTGGRRRTTHIHAIDIDYNVMAGTESYRDTRANRHVHRRAILLGQKLYNADDLARLSSRSSRWSKDQAQLRANCRWM